MAKQRASTPYLRVRFLSLLPIAHVMKLGDIRDLKSLGLNGRGGSNPLMSTKSNNFVNIF